MYYISCKVGSKYGIIDTEDGKTEFYTPAQIANFVSRGINVIGFNYQINGYSIAIAHPSQFQFDSEEFITTGYKPDIDKKFDVKAKLAGQNNDFSKMFKDVPFRGDKSHFNYPELKLAHVDFHSKELIFSFNYDYTCGDSTCAVKDLIECWGNSLFKQRTRLLFGTNPDVLFNKTIRWDKPFISLQLNHKEFGYLMSLIDLFYTKKPNLSGIQSNIEDTQILSNLYIHPSSNRTNVGLMTCYYLYTYIDIYKIPLVSRARANYIYTEDASDSEIYYKCIRHNLKLRGK